MKVSAASALGRGSVKLQPGFTLIELMIVITVIAILATIVLFGLGKAQSAARDTQRQGIARGLQVALQGYYRDNRSFPASVSLVSTYMASFVDPGCGTSPVTLSLNTMVNNQTPGCGSVTYSYVPDVVNGVYTLTLSKESGGSSVFKSPF